MIEESSKYITFESALLNCKENLVFLTCTSSLMLILIASPSHVLPFSAAYHQHSSNTVPADDVGAQQVAEPTLPHPPHPHWGKSFCMMPGTKEGIDAFLRWWWSCWNVNHSQNVKEYSDPFNMKSTSAISNEMKFESGVVSFVRLSQGLQPSGQPWVSTPAISAKGTQPKSHCIHQVFLSRQLHSGQIPANILVSFGGENHQLTGCASYCTGHWWKYSLDLDLDM